VKLKLCSLTGPARFPSPACRGTQVSTFYLKPVWPPVVLPTTPNAAYANLVISADHRVIAGPPGFGESSARTLYRLRALAGGAARSTRYRQAHLIARWRRIRSRPAKGAGRIDRLALLAPAVAFKKLRQLVPFVRLLRPELGAIPMLFPRASVLSTLRMLFGDHRRLAPDWYEAAADEFLRVAATSRGRICLFSAARQIYLDDPWGARGFWSRLARLERPALFVWGDRDLLVPAKFCSHVSRTLPHAECVVLRDCGHVPQFEHPERTHALVRSFLKR
jgi:hypothetical protein